jgi:hypothetical protein
MAAKWAKGSAGVRGSGLAAGSGVKKAAAWALWLGLGWGQERARGWALGWEQSSALEKVLGLAQGSGLGSVQEWAPEMEVGPELKRKEKGKAKQSKKKWEKGSGQKI